MSRRIQARAIDRCGRVLEEIEPARGRQGRNDDGTIHVPAPSQNGRTQAAIDAGLSERQRVTAMRVHNVPRDQFKQLVEGDDLPTVTKLAELGRGRRSALQPAAPRSLCSRHRRSRPCKARACAKAQTPVKRGRTSRLAPAQPHQRRPGSFSPGQRREVALLP